MAKSRRIQWSFAGGEMSPEMFGHVQDVGYQTGVAKARNVNAKPSGALHRRGGFQFQATAEGATQPSRLVRFVFSPEDTLVLEFSAGAIRFFDSDGPVAAYTGTPPAFIASTSATFGANWLTTGEFTLGANSYVGDERVQFTGSVPSPLAVGVDYFVVYSSATEVKVSPVPGGLPVVGWAAGVPGTMSRHYDRGDVAESGGDNFYCKNANLSVATSNTAYWYELPSTGVLEVETGYLQSQLFELGFTQSADVLTITHPMHPTFELARYGETNWVFRWVDWNGASKPPSTVRTLPTYGRVFNIASGAVASTGSPAVTKTYLYFEAPHEMSEGDGLFLEGVTGLTSNPDGRYVATDTQVAIGGYASGQVLALKVVETGEYHNGVAGVPTTGTMRYAPISSDSDNTYVITSVDQNGIESVASVEATEADNLLYVEGSSNRIEWTSSYGAKSYRVYKEQSGLFGYIGTVDQIGFFYFQYFIDDNIAPDMGITPPIEDPSLAVESKAVTSISLAEPGIVTIGLHGMREGDPCWFPSLTGGAGVTLWKRYLVGSPVTPSTFALYEEDGVTPVDVTTGYSAATLHTGDFPSAVAYFEQRRVFAGSRRLPQGLWLTRTGTESDLRYSLPLKDTDRIAVGVSARQASTIRHIVPMDHLLLLTSSCEYRVTPLNNDAITPTSISARPQTYIGSSHVAPMVVNNTIVFCANRGGHVREMGYQAAAQAFSTGDLSLRAAHLFDDYMIIDADQMKAPHSILCFTSSSGKLLNLTYVPEESIGAWTWYDTNDGDDTFESVAIVPDGDEDSVWACINRGGTYTIEKMAPMAVTTLAACRFMDSWIERSVTVGGSFACAHIANGRTVQVMVNGTVYPNQVVAAGAVTAPATGTMVVGLPYVSEIQTMPFTAQTESLAQGVPKDVNEVWIRVYESGPFEVGPNENNLSPSDPYAETAGTLKTGEVNVTLLGAWTEDGQIVIRQTLPLPLTVVSATTLVSYGGN